MTVRMTKLLADARCCNCQQVDDATTAVVVNAQKLALGMMEKWGCHKRSGALRRLDDVVWASVRRGRENMDEAATGAWKSAQARKSRARPLPRGSAHPGVMTLLEAEGLRLIWLSC